MPQPTSVLPGTLGEEPGAVAPLERRVQPVLRAGSIRHVAIVVAAVVAWGYQRHFALSPPVFWVLASAALANVAIATRADRFGRARFGRILSPALGIGAWAMLVHLTGGARSVLVAGFWLEIALAPLVLGPAQILGVVGAAIAALWAQEGIVGIPSNLVPLCVETAFLAASGALTWWVSVRVGRREHALAIDAMAMSGRLRTLERQLEDAQAASRVGEHAARVAHAAKSAVHSLRGFTKLIEPPLLSDASHRRALEGLRLAIDRLDEISRLVLRPPGADAPRAMTGQDVSRTLEEVIREVEPLHASIRWAAELNIPIRGIGLSSGDLRQVVLTLLQNAIEASGPRGEITLQLKVVDGMLRIMVRDRGPGISPAAHESLFQVGATTKPDGSGFGLFLARRLVEAQGGHLIAESPDGGGALFAVSLPLCEG